MPHQLRLFLSVFVSGAVVMALELLGSRLLAPVFGNSIFVWGSLIGVVLAALSAGYYLGGKLADLKPEFQSLSIIIFAAAILVLALPSLAPALFDLVIKLDIGDRYSPLLATTVLLGPPSLLLGMVSPYGIRLTAKTYEKIGKVSGNLYALSTLGSIVGTFLTVFVLIPEFGVNKIIVALGVTLLIVAFLGLGFRMKVLVLLILMIVPFAAPYMVSRRLTAATYTLALGDTIYETDTPYHHLVVADSFDPERQSYIRILILDDNFHSAMDLKDPGRTVFAYTDYFHLGFLLNPSITRVLFIGGGGFTGPKAFLSDYPNVTVDVAEIDPEVIRVAEQYFAVNASNPRLHIYNEDGRIFLQKTNEKYDLVVLDAYSKSYVPFHLMTTEFFGEVANHLTPKGDVISNLISGLYGDRAQLLEAEAKTMRGMFQSAYVFPVRGSDYREPQNTIIVATLDSTFLSEADFEGLASATSIVRVPAMKDYVANYLTLGPSDAPVLTDNFAPVENLLNPITGQPLTPDQALSIDWRELGNLAAIVIAIAMIFLALKRKKLL
jgi:predicted membrane-bound spermidine synthase